MYPSKYTYKLFRHTKSKPNLVSVGFLTNGLVYYLVPQVNVKEHLDAPIVAP